MVFVSSSMQSLINSTTNSSDAICSGLFDTNKSLRNESLSKTQMEGFKELLDCFSIKSTTNNIMGNYQNDRKEQY